MLAWVTNSSDTGGEVEGCSWVAEDPSARCRVNGSIPYVGCADPTNIGRPDCNFQVLFAAAPAYSGCCETCGFGTCLTIVPTMKPTTSSKSESKNQLRAQRWIERVSDLPDDGRVPAPPTPQSDGDISPTFSSRLPRPPIARNDHGLGSTWSGDYS